MLSCSRRGERRTCLLLLSSIVACASAGTVSPRIPPAGLGGVWDSLEPIISKAMAAQDTELEMRFGIHQPGEGGFFPAGVPEANFREMCERLEESASSGHMERCSQGWVESRDLHYRSKMRLTEEDNKAPVVIGKVLIDRIDMGGAASGDEECMVRFSWKEERPYTPPSDRSELGLLEGVRLKRRKSFKYKMWRYDLTEVRGAPISSEEGLEAAIAGVPPSYEIEVELLRDCLPLGISPEYVSHSMLLKAHDMCAMLLRCKITRPTLRITAPGTGAIFTGSNLPRESREGHEAEASGGGAGSMQAHETVSPGPGGAPTSSSGMAQVASAPVPVIDEPEIVAEEEGDWD